MFVNLFVWIKHMQWPTGFFFCIKVAAHRSKGDAIQFSHFCLSFHFSLCVSLSVSHLHNAHTHTYKLCVHCFTAVVCCFSYRNIERKTEKEREKQNLYIYVESESEFILQIECAWVSRAKCGFALGVHACTQTHTVSIAQHTLGVAVSPLTLYA